MSNSHDRPNVLSRFASLATSLLVALALPGTVVATSEVLRPADQVVVVKSERRLYLMRDGQPMKSYKIALGLNPSGPKEREGDFRTPEGRYRLDLRNASSEYFLSIRVSYPNDDDVVRARKKRLSPGGSIMIHGLPNVPKHSAAYYSREDWTNGCIALTNDDMLEVWLLTRSNTPIEIRP